MWKPLNKPGQESYDPWPYIPTSMSFEEFRNEVVAAQIRDRGYLDAHVVDFGCGDGRTLAHLSEQGIKDLTGIDHSEEGLRRTRLRVPGVETIWGDLLAIEAVECEVAICTEVLEHLPADADVVKVMKLLFNSLIAGGMAIISVPDDSICAIDEDHRRLFTPEDPVYLLRDAGFAHVQNVTYHYSDEHPWPWMTARGYRLV